MKEHIWDVKNVVAPWFAQTFHTYTDRRGRRSLQDECEHGAPNINLSICLYFRNDTQVVPYGISILFVRLIIVLGDDSTKGFPLRGSWRGTRLMRCSPSQRALSPLEFNGCSASYTSSVSHSLNTFPSRGRLSVRC